MADTNDLLKLLHSTDQAPSDSSTTNPGNPDALTPQEIMTRNGVQSGYQAATKDTQNLNEQQSASTDPFAALGINMPHYQQTTVAPAAVPKTTPLSTPKPTEPFQGRPFVTPIERQRMESDAAPKTYLSALPANERPNALKNVFDKLEISEPIALNKFEDWWNSPGPTAPRNSKGEYVVPVMNPPGEKAATWEKTTDSYGNTTYLAPFNDPSVSKGLIPANIPYTKGWALLNLGLPFLIMGVQSMTDSIASNRAEQSRTNLQNAANNLQDRISAAGEGATVTPESQSYENLISTVLKEYQNPSSFTSVKLATGESTNVLTDEAVSHLADAYADVFDKAGVYTAAEAAYSGEAGAQAASETMNNLVPIAPETVSNFANGTVPPQSTTAAATEILSSIPNIPTTEKSDSIYLYHRTTTEALDGIKKEGMTTGDFTAGKAIDFPGNVTIRIKSSVLQNPQIGEYGKGVAWYLPDYEHQGPIPATDIEVKTKNGWKPLVAPVETGPSAAISTGETGNQNLVRETQPLYLGTNNVITSLPSTVNASINSTNLGDVATIRHGIFLTDSPDLAKQYGQNVMQLNTQIDPARIAQLDPSKIATQSDPIVNGFIGSLGEGKTEDERATLLAADSASEPQQFFENNLGARFTDYLKQQGYQAAQFQETTKATPEGTAKTTVVFYPDLIESNVDNNNIDIYHFSKQPLLTEISPDHMGTGYTGQAVNAPILTNANRSFWVTGDTSVDPVLRQGNLYKATVSKNDLAVVKPGEPIDVRAILEQGKKGVIISDDSADPWTNGQVQMFRPVPATYLGKSADAPAGLPLSEYTGAMAETFVDVPQPSTMNKDQVITFIKTGKYGIFSVFVSAGPDATDEEKAAVLASNKAKAELFHQETGKDILDAAYGGHELSFMVRLDQVDDYARAYHQQSYVTADNGHFEMVDIMSGRKTMEGNAVAFDDTFTDFYTELPALNGQTVRMSMDLHDVMGGEMSEADYAAKQAEVNKALADADQLSDRLSDVIHETLQITVAQAAIHSLLQPVDPDKVHSMLNTRDKLQSVLVGLNINPSAVRTDLLSTGWKSLIGTKVENAYQMADLAQMVRDPRFEHGWIIITNSKGAVIAVNHVSLGVPGFTQMFIAGRTGDGINSINEYCAGHDGAKVYLIHNHPSGNVTMSDDDEIVYMDIMRGVNVPCVGIVIDHDKATISTMADTMNSSMGLEKHEVESLNTTPNTIHEALIPNSILGYAIFGSYDAAVAASVIQRDPDMAVLLYRSSSGSAVAVEIIPTGAIQNNAAFHKHIGESTLSYGARDVIAVVDAKYLENHTWFRGPLWELVQDGYLEDAVSSTIDPSDPTVESTRRKMDENVIPISWDFEDKWFAKNRWFGQPMHISSSLISRNGTLVGAPESLSDERAAWEKKAAYSVLLTEGDHDIQNRLLDAITAGRLTLGLDGTLRPMNWFPSKTIRPERTETENGGVEYSVKDGILFAPSTETLAKAEGITGLKVDFLKDLGAKDCLKRTHNFCVGKYDEKIAKDLYGKLKHLLDTGSPYFFLFGGDPVGTAVTNPAMQASVAKATGFLDEAGIKVPKASLERVIASLMLDEKTAIQNAHKIYAVMRIGSIGMGSIGDTKHPVYSIVMNADAVKVFKEPVSMNFVKAAYIQHAQILPENASETERMQRIRSQAGNAYEFITSGKKTWNIQQDAGFKRLVHQLEAFPTYRQEVPTPDTLQENNARYESVQPQQDRTLMVIQSKPDINEFGRDNIERAVNGKQPWEMTFEEFLKTYATIPQMPRVPEQGEWYAIMTDDGSIFTADNYDMHAMIAQKCKIPFVRMVSGGIVRDGSYWEIGNTAVESMSERAMARERLRYKQMIRRAKALGLTVMDDPLMRSYNDIDLAKAAVYEEKAPYDGDITQPLRASAIGDSETIATPAVKLISNHANELRRLQGLERQVDNAYGIINAVKVNEDEFAKIIGSLNLGPVDAKTLVEAYRNVSKSTSNTETVWNMVNKVYKAASVRAAKDMMTQQKIRDLTQDQKDKAKAIGRLQAEKVAKYIIEHNREIVHNAYMKFMDDLGVPASIFRTPASVIRAYENIKGEKSLARAEAYVQRKIDEAQRAELIDAIRNTVAKIRGSKNVAVDYREQALALADEIEWAGHTDKFIDRIQKMADAVEQQRSDGEDPDLNSKHLHQLEILSRKPVADMTMDELQDLKDTLDDLAGWGVLKQKLRNDTFKLEVSNLVDDLAPTVQAQDEAARREVDSAAFIENGRGNGSNLLDARDAVKRFWLGDKPAWMLFKILGVPQLKTRMDDSFNSYLDLRDNWRSGLREIADRNQLTSRNMRRIGIVMHSQDIDGQGVMDEWGITETQLKEISSSLTNGEREYMEAARALLDTIYPKLDRSMQQEFNLRVGYTEDYFPRMKDFSVIDNLEVKNRFGQLYDMDTGKPITNEVGAGQRKNVEIGETKHRVASRNRSELNAARVMERYIDDVAYQIAMTHEIRVGKTAIDQAPIQENLGAIGYTALSEYYAMMARKGGTIGGRTVPIIDWMRKNVASFQILWKLTSAVVQWTQYSDTIAMVGPYWATIGFNDFLGSKEWRRFCISNSPKIRDMVGDDPSYMDLSEHWWSKAGGFALESFDKGTRIASYIAAYKQYCWANDLEADPMNPIQEACDYAQETVGKILASPFAIDMPLVLSTGYGIGNKSIARMILQFQNPMLFRAANIEDQVIGGYGGGDRNNNGGGGLKGGLINPKNPQSSSGIRGGNYRGAIWAFLMMVLFSAMVEAAVRRGSKKMLGGTNSDTYAKDVLDQIVGNVPYIGQFYSALQYGNNPVPVIAMIGDGFTYASRFKAAKTLSSKTKAALYLVGTTAGLFGVLPGGSQILQIMRYNFLDTKTKKLWAEAPASHILEPGQTRSGNGNIASPGAVSGSNHIREPDQVGSGGSNITAPGAVSGSNHIKEPGQ